MMQDLSRKILVVLNVRKESHRIKDKVLAPFAGRTLLDIAAEKVFLSKIIPPKDILFSYDKKFSTEFTAIIKKFTDLLPYAGVNNIYERSDSSCYEENNQEKIYEFAIKYNRRTSYDSFMLINVCCPLLRTETIDSFYSTFKYSDKAGLFGVIKKQNYIWGPYKKPINLPDKGQIMNTKDESCRIYEAAHCLYASRLDLVPQRRFMGGFTEDGPDLFIVPENETFDIDYPWQFEYGQILYKGLNNGC